MNIKVYLEKNNIIMLKNLIMKNKLMEVIK